MINLLNYFFLQKLTISNNILKNKTGNFKPKKLLTYDLMFWLNND